GREGRGLQFARTVELDGAFDAAAGALDQKIVDADRLRLGGERERRPRRLAGRLDPAGQEAVELRRSQVRLDGEFAVTVRPGADAAGELERNAAADGARRIEAEIGSRSLVEHALQADFGRVIAARLAVFEAGWRTADLDVTLERKALVVGDHF